MAPAGRLLAAFALLLAAGLADSGAPVLLLAETFSAPTGTPLWFAPGNTEARLYRLVLPAGTVGQARAVAERGEVQMHVLPDDGGSPVWRPDRLASMDWVPAKQKTRWIAAGDWVVAVDPSTPGTRVAVEIYGEPGALAWRGGTWTCPAVPLRGCLP